MGNSELTIKEGYKQTDVGVVPEDWKVSTVGREFEIRLGKMLDAEKNIGTLKPYLGNKSVQWNRIDLDESQMMAMTQADLKRFRLRQGDLLVCEGGEVGRAAIWESPIKECYYQKALHRLRPLRKFNTKLFLEFLHYWTNHEMLGNYVSQTSIAHLTREKFAKVPLPVPPLPEQQAIAEVLSDVDALITSLNQLITKKRNIKQGTMQLLLTGKKRLPNFSGDWETRTLESVCPNGGLVRGPFGGALKKEFFVRDGIKVYEQKNAIYRDCNLGRYFVDNDKYLELKRFEVEEGDFIVSCSGTIGRIYQIPKQARIGIINQALLKIKTDSKQINDKFFFYFFDWEKFQEKIVDSTQGGAMQNLVGMEIFRNTEMFIPPSLEEQKAIAQILSDIDAEIEALEIQRDKYKAVKQGMMQELLTGKTRLI